MNNKFNYTNTPDDIANALFDYIGYVKSENKEQFNSIELGLRHLLCNAENPYNNDCFKEFYAILDEFVEVYKEREFENR